MPGWILNTSLHRHKARVNSISSRPLLLRGLLCAFLLLCGTVASVASAQTEPRWRNTVWLLADNSDKSQQHRNWQELDQKEKQRIYRRHKQFKTWSVEEQQKVCAAYYELTGENPPACRANK